jgi:hypothetical protein
VKICQLKIIIHSRFIALFCWLCLHTSVAMAQNEFAWWNKKHDWDGKTPWEYYLTSSPAFMGPNALPVPETKTGLLPDKTTLEISFEGHFSTGDKTQNLFANAFFPIGSDRAGLAVWMVPVEHYKMDTVTRDLRAARDHDGEGYAVGDVYVGTYIQLLKNKPKLPDILLTINLKTASGGHFEAARFTDAPAYYFDMSFGKTFLFPNKLVEAVRPYAMGGFYCWQMNGGKHYQNDAPMYGAGFYADLKNIRIDNSLNGYMGYMKNGDRPLVYRAAITSRFSSAVNFKTMFEEGLHDFPYTSVRLGAELDLGRIFTPASSRE